MRTKSILTLLILIFGCLGPRLDAVEEPPVELPPFTVVAELFTLQYHVDSSGRLSRAKVTDVTPKTRVSPALRAGDSLVEINGHPIVGMNKVIFEGYLNEPVTQSTTKVFTFIGKRGVFGLGRAKIEVTLSWKDVHRSA